MPFPTETYTQVAPNSTGNKVRNLQITTLDDSGNANVVEMQVVSIADGTGRNVLDLDLAQWLRELVITSRQIRTLLKFIADEISPNAASADDLLSGDQLNEHEE